MQDTFDKPPLRIEHTPSMGPPLLSLSQRWPVSPIHRTTTQTGATELPPWILPIQLRLDSIIRQQDLILDRLEHPWRYRWAWVRVQFARLVDRLKELRWPHEP